MHLSALSYLSPKATVRGSPIHGRGLFATEELRPGEIVCVKGGYILARDPNIGVQGQIVFIALRQIAAGEDLTHDWATTDDDDYALACHCGATRCRGTITGKDWQREDLQRKYRGLFSWYLQRKIDAGSLEDESE